MKHAEPEQVLVIQKSVDKTIEVVKDNSEKLASITGKTADELEESIDEVKSICDDIFENIRVKMDYGMTYGKTSVLSLTDEQQAVVKANAQNSSRFYRVSFVCCIGGC